MNTQTRRGIKRYLSGVMRLLATVALTLTHVVAEENVSIRLSDDLNMDFIWVADLELWAGACPVTLEQYIQISKEAARHPERFSVRNDDGVDPNEAPAVMISWDDAQRACQTLIRRHSTTLPSGFVFRLPTEEEWEAMARAGDNRKYPWGDSWPPTPMADGILPNLQGVEMISSRERHVHESMIENYKDGWSSVAPAGKSGANEWGIYGLAGNVTEWCEGWYDKNRKLRLMKGSSAFDYNSSETKISGRGRVEGQSAVRGWFIWGTVRNQGNVASGFRVVIGQPLGR